MSYRDPDWAGRFLRDPEKVWPASRRMPNLHLKDEEIGNLIAFLSWVDKIDTNNWPPNPMATRTGPATGQATRGEKLFRTAGCTSCHTIGGTGGHIGPDLTKIGSERNKEWIEEQIKNPKSHNPNSIMPSFASTLSKEDMEDLADYLSGSK
jgi:sulfur oxidation c-type cytochrome SoxX